MPSTRQRRSLAPRAVKAFADRWADPTLKSQSEAFLSTFVDGAGKRIESPSLLCRRNARVDGQPPAQEEIQALELAIAFAFLDENPRHTSDSRRHGWAVLTADNTELYVWPVDVEAGYVSVATGLMVRTLGGGYRISDPELAIRPPLDLHLPLGAHTAAAMCLEAVYETVLQSLQAPGVNLAADRLRVAIGWFVNAWRNTATPHFPERLVFLKTAFEALTGTSKSYRSARSLRQLFEAIPDTTPQDSELLVWSPTEAPIHTRTYKRNGTRHRDQITDLEQWFMALADARNAIIHQGIVPSLVYTGPNPEYIGDFVFTAEFLLRAVVKVSLAAFGYPDLWRSDAWRAIKAAYEEVERRQREGEQKQNSGGDDHSI